jgi:hypothetical protein
MSWYRSIELALSAFVLLLGVATVVLARYTIEELSVLQDTIGARGFAYVIGTAVAIGGLILLVTQLRGMAGGARPAGGVDAIELGGDDPRYPASGARSFAVFAALVAYALLIYPAGYIPATMAFVAGGTWIMGGRGTARIMVFPFIYAISTYLLFDTVLGVRIPDGLLAPAVDALGLD